MSIAFSHNPASDYLRVRNAVRHFNTPEGGVVKALDGINLNIGQSEFITLLGPSGCGKTTLLKIIAGFERLDSGKITLDSQTLLELSAHRRPVNTVFQSYALFPHMSVGDNVGYGLEVAGVKKPERVQRIGEALEMVGLAGIEKRLPSQLSGGQQQRVALARAIVNRPKVLLLDEPLSALDRHLRMKMQIELKNLQTELGICFLFVTHDQEEALTMSDRIVVLNGGKVEQLGTPTEIYHRPASRFVADFIGESNVFEGKVVRFDDFGADVQCGELLIRTEDRNLITGSAVEVMLRPEQFTLLDSSTSAAGQQVLTATLEQAVFVGSDHQLVCRLASGQQISALVRGHCHHLQVGQPLQLAYSSADVHTIPAVF
ncbi:ABC transporter ATP-binding protein [Oceanobacter kriegii]|uniref:ABC transporter ATP-binding protein n=1 Tax=Oceanobacter kriegii TaxID=64972 RepID=UPI0004816462|nr:ABC transporter ATP-binding protein [Oceanobacter kriegii]